MVLEEKISRHLGKPYVYLKDKKKFLCSNGVLFTLEEYKDGIDINAEYERREKEGTLYDYAYAKSTGLLRKKRGLGKMELAGLEERTPHKIGREESLGNAEGNGRALLEEPFLGQADMRANREKDARAGEEGVVAGQDNEGIHEKPAQEAFAEIPRVTEQEKGSEEPLEAPAGCRLRVDGNGRTVASICLLLAFTSLVSGYISTLHTATYLSGYVDVVSAWLMSASITAYNATAFEVAVLFKGKKRRILALTFMTLWAMVTLFSMATTVSVFYDRFNFTEKQIAEENKGVDSGKLALSLLQKKEADLREAVAFKKKDMEYRQERDYATTALRLELEKLQAALQENLSEQQTLLEGTPEIVSEEASRRKESLFGFLGRMMGVEGGALEFIMSTLSAIFVNLIAPLSLTAVAELLRKRVDTSN